MAVSTVWIGRAPASPEPDYATLTGGSLRGSAFAPTTQHLWGVSFRYRAGRPSAGSSPAARAAAHLMGSGAPGARRGYSAQATLSAVMDEAAGGDWVTSPVALVDGGPTNAAIPIPSGTRLLLDLLVTGATANVGMIAAGRMTSEPDADKNLYSRAGLSQPPPNPFGSASVSYEGQLTIGLECHVNEPPVVPVNRTPGSTDAATPTPINETSPVIAFDHRDRNGAWGVGNDGYDDGDYLNQARVELQRWDGSAWVAVWSTTATADAAMRSANRFTITYPGTLTRGTKYRWRCQSSDHFNAWGPLSGWLYFIVANLGLVTLAGNPTGKIETKTPSFDFSWTHQSGLATNAVEVRLYRNGTLSQSSPTITKSVASGASGSITWAETAFTSLLWGQTTWEYEVRGRDTNGVWSDWSARRGFATNAPPGIPDSLSPSNSQIVTARPLLTARMIDPDDTVATGLVLKFRIKNASGTVLQTRSATYNATTGLWEYQTTSADLAAFGTFKADAYSGDGTLWSGGVTLEANAAKSAEATFVYANGPQVTITAPASGAVLTSSTPTITWTCATQNRYRVRFYERGTTTVAYEYGWITSTATKQHTVAAGYLRNNHLYDLEVGCEDTAPLQGFATIPVSTAYTPPATPTGVAAVPVPIGNDPWPTAILVQADPSPISVGLFVGRYLYRDDITAGPIAILTSPTATAWIDYAPVSGREHVYTWRDVAYVDSSQTEQIESAGVSVVGVVQLRGVVLSSVLDPEGVRVVLESAQERSRRLTQDKARLSTWTSAKPRTYYGASEFWEISGSYRLKRDAGTSATERERQLEAVLLAKQTLCYRDERGRKYFVLIDDNDFGDARPQNGLIQLTFVEEDFQEAILPGASS